MLPDYPEAFLFTKNPGMDDCRGNENLSFSKGIRFIGMKFRFSGACGPKIHLNSF